MRACIWQSDWNALGSILVEKLVASGEEVRVLIKNGQKPQTTTNLKLPQGATQVKTLVAALEGARQVLTLLSTPQEVEDLYLGSGGILELAQAESLFIDLSPSSPRLAKELQALAAVHEHSFVEAPFEGDAATFEKGTTRFFAAGEPDHIEAALEVLSLLSPQIIATGLPGTGTSMKIASQIALAGALMGVVESLTFATLAGVDSAVALDILSKGASASAVAQAFGQKIIDEDFLGNYDLRLFFNDLTTALDAADELGLALPGLETAHQLYDLLVLVGGGEKGIQALSLIYYDEERCATHGLNWELAQRAMDVYERANDRAMEDYDYEFEDDDECDDPHCGHHHHFYDDDDSPPQMGSYFSSN